MKTVGKLYHYNAVVTGVYDGDTCTVDIDLGMNTWLRGEKIRLYRINSPEIVGKTKSDGIISRDYLIKLVLDKAIIIQTIKDRKEKYGRYLGEIWITGKNGLQKNINDEMVKAKMAVYMKG
ncbi:MAG: thermonuclease family protein [Bacteroidota bacterium]|nr:thermonuclease family protein [Bacteroidota bacterium]